jgi:hypothetical protein
LWGSQKVEECETDIIKEIETEQRGNGNEGRKKEKYGLI